MPVCSSKNSGTWPIRTLYDASNKVCGMITCRPSLAHVPVEDFLDVFEELAITSMPQQHQGMDELLTYFEHTYIRGRRLPGRA